MLVGITLAAAIVSCGINGTWSGEVAQLDSRMQASTDVDSGKSTENWVYTKLTPEQQQKITDRYFRESHERIVAPTAYIERDQEDPRVTSYSVVFVDKNDCITFRINTANYNK